MTIERDLTELFQAELVAHVEMHGAQFHLFSNRIFYVELPEYDMVGQEIIQFGYEFLNQNGGGTFFNIYQFRSFTDIEQEVREWAADPGGNLYTISDAIVLGNVGQKILSDFYLKINRPVKPTKVFNSLNKAIDWTFDQMEKNR